MMITLTRKVRPSFWLDWDYWTGYMLIFIRYTVRFCAQFCPSVVAGIKQPRYKVSTLDFTLLEELVYG